MQNTRYVDLIAGRIEQVRSRIARACERAGRTSDEVILIAVTKTVPAETVKRAIDAGIRHVGENRVQEARDKLPLLGESACVNHLIGHLQTNKARYVPQLFHWFHALDSERLAAALGARCEAEGRTLNCLLQVNVSGEDTKFGVPKERLPALAEAVSAIGGIKIRGLMTIAPYGADERALRRTFGTLRNAAGALDAEGFPNVTMEHLSMGMSGDYEIAVEEGATMVRVGSAIFGPRD